MLLFINSYKKLWLLLVLLALLPACQENTTQKPPADTNTTACVAHSTPFAHTICSINDTSRLSLHWQDTNGNPLYTFKNLMEKHGAFTFAMNAGMYDSTFAPIGYTVIDGKTLHAINANRGKGNFHLMPNGVFWWDDTGAFVDSTPDFTEKLKNGVYPKYATQSGPMLVINGQIHPKFDPKNTSHKIRNGVGVDCTDKRTHFIISDEPVGFYQFADVFKSGLGCQNALFLDGGIASALYTKNLGRQDDINMAVMMAYQ